MAWVTQSFISDDGKFELILYSDRVFLDPGDGQESVMFHPSTKDEAHTLAMLLRRAARRLEEIGKGLE